jgi:hypothetical protein
MENLFDFGLEGQGFFGHGCVDCGCGVGYQKMGTFLYCGRSCVFQGAKDVVRNNFPF